MTRKKGAAEAPLFFLDIFLRKKVTPLRPIQLSPRLQAVAGCVPPGARFVDVGTDHAYLPAYLLQQGVIDHAVASDLRQGPLERARETARRYGLGERISFRLCDGLSGVSPEEAQAVAIAGMGGETIIAILAAAPWTRLGERRLILQPMSTLPELRAWLQGHGYAIRRELLRQEGHTIYTILDVMPGEMPPLSPAECWAGRQETGRGDPLRSALLEHLQKRVERALGGIAHSDRPEDVPWRRELEEVLTGVKAMRKELEACTP